MPTDDERRRIAANLRANAGTGYIEVEPLCEAIGCDARRGSGEGIVWNRLADLIDPDLRDESFCKVCGHVIPAGWSECPRCKTKVVSDD